MTEYLPYIVSVVSAIVAGISSYASARRKSKNDIALIVKQHEVDIEALERKHQMEIEKINLEHVYQLELQEKNAGVQIGSSLLTEIMKNPAMQAYISQEMRKGGK